MKLLGFILLTILIHQAHAFDTPYIMQSPRGLLMGDAFTAVNDDEFTMFYNPASLARHKSDFTFYPLNPQLSGTNVLNDMSRFEDFPSEPVGAADVLMNYPVHASAGIAPGFKLFNFGMTLISNQSYDILLRNPSHPMLDLDLKNDKGFQMGVGIPLGTDRINRKSKMGSQTSLGLSAKYIERTGIRDTLALAGPTTIGALSSEDIADIAKSLGSVKGIGYGFDTGLEHVSRSGNSQFVFGLSALNVGGVKFREQSSDNLQVSDIRDQVNLGMAAGQNSGLFHYIVSMDVRALNEQMDFGKRLRLGGRLGIPGVSLMAGVNSGYYSYGAMLDLAFMKLAAGFYDIELGSKYKQVQSKRFVIYLSLFDFSFDA